MNLEHLLQHCEKAAAIPPVDHWQPPFCGDMPLTIKADGSWWHEGAPFTRPELVRLLASLLRRDPEGVCLVTPAERVRIEVEDCPLTIVAAHQVGGDWRLTTHHGDTLTLDADHPLTMTRTPGGDEAPEVPVRFGLAARLNRNVYYQLVDAASLREHESHVEVGVESAGSWHVLGTLSDAEASGAPWN
ncbi:MAG: DUF1285 domain-containing protein [Halomonas sp.]|nr:DUF1285 domain-containing protein [Halomonas sp.]MDN6296742.1 DUF1285 domain-containing protein [Halomonas sp.]MDN6314016.1 DUF1285 domain-containing protein [Halomonas sp.]MDN6335440.1 DUF1285 domain-containing protein [Halomonas sp.]